MKAPWYYDAIEAAKNVQTNPDPFYHAGTSADRINIAIQKLDTLLEDSFICVEIAPPAVLLRSTLDKDLNFYVDYETGQWNIIRHCQRCYLGKWVKITAPIISMQEFPIPTLESIGEGLLQTIGCSGCLTVSSGDPAWPSERWG